MSRPNKDTDKRVTARMRLRDSLCNKFEEKLNDVPNSDPPDHEYYIRLMMEDLDTMTPGEVAFVLSLREAQLADMTLARDEIQKLHDITIEQLAEVRREASCLWDWAHNWDSPFIEDEHWRVTDGPRIKAAITGDNDE